MKKGNLGSLLNRATELEKKYEWLQAAKTYQKASQIALENNKFEKVSELYELIGFCYYRTARQANNNIEFNERLRLAIQAYDKETRVLEKCEKENREAKIKHSEALAAFMRSLLETDASRKKELLDEWWTLENQALTIYEKTGDFHSAGLVCNEMIEYAQLQYIYLTEISEWRKLEKETMKLIDKAVLYFSESDDEYELAKTYCFATWKLIENTDPQSPELEDKRLQLVKRAQDYSRKALEISIKTGDAWLIGYSYSSAERLVSNISHQEKLAIEYSEKIREHGRIAKDKFLLILGTVALARITLMLVEFLEDPDKQRESCEKVRKLTKEYIGLSRILNHVPGIFYGNLGGSAALLWLSLIETDPQNKERMLEKAIEINKECLKRYKEWKLLKGLLNYALLGHGLRGLSHTKSSLEEKKTLLLKAESYQKKQVEFLKEKHPLNEGLSLQLYNLVMVQHDLANIENCKIKKVELLKKALASLEESNKRLERPFEIRPSSSFGKAVLWKHNDRLGRILQQLHSLTKEAKLIEKAINAYKNAADASEKADLPTRTAESCWNMARLLSERGDLQEANQSYKAAAKAYDAAGKKIPQLRQFYRNHSIYMRSWSKIYLARDNHSLEEYGKAKQHYTEAAELHEESQSWSYLAPNYFAWASMEEAESLSRSENTQKAKEAFQKTLQKFEKAEKTIKQKLEETTPSDEKEIMQKLLQASNLRRRYCRARILVENAKLLDRQGKYLQSSKSYQEAASNISKIVETAESEIERKEMKYLAILCQAWEKMAKAEETTSSESYLEAAKFFEKAKEHCYTKKASLWAMGNSSFCKGLAAKIQFQTTFEKSHHSMAKKHLKQAEDYYKTAGFQTASEYAKATQRLFDAYLYINSAEEEVDPERKTKYYQLAEQLLQIAAGSFMKAKQPEKTAQVKQILENVKEEKKLAISFNQVLQAPSIASTTQSFTAPSPTSEVSVGLEQFQHANVQANLIAGLREVKVGESFCLTVEFINAGKEPALLTRVEDFVPPDFIVVKKPEIYRLEDACLNMKGKQIAPLKLVEAKLVLQSSKKGVYHLRPTVHYLDELGQSKSLQLKSVEIKVEEVFLADRVSTGTKELDSLLLGGIPKEYAIVLTGAPSDEREMLIRNFLEAGTRQGQTSFYVTTEAAGSENLLDKSGFYLLLCNPKPKVEVPDLPNVYRLHGKTDLTNLNIALLKAYRNVEQSSSKRVCINIVSDVLVDFGVKATRKWVAELTTDLVSKGFTILAVLDPTMHPADHANAIINLFDGEISLYQTEDPLECKKSLRVKKLRNQDYIKNAICLR